MRLVIQRVKQSTVNVDGRTIGSIRSGLVLFIGISREDTRSEADYLLDKVLGLRIFADDNGKMNRNIVDSGGALLLVPQFTLYGDCVKGRRPNFDRAAPPEMAQRLYEYFVESARPDPTHYGGTRISAANVCATQRSVAGLHPARCRVDPAQ